MASDRPPNITTDVIGGAKSTSASCSSLPDTVLSGRIVNSTNARRGRRIALRIAAILTGLAVFPLFELLCVVAGWGDVRFSTDPFAGFASVRPLFELTADGTSWHTAPSRRGFFEEDSFLKSKPSNEFRIFVFGGSTVQGNPFSIETSFTRFLQLALQEAEPERTWEVVNCGGISYASYRLLPLMQECLAYEPDAYIVCTGHNEFLEDVSFSAIRNQNPTLTTIYSGLNRFRSFRLATRLADRTRGSTSHPDSRDQLSTEVDAMLDHQGGLAAYHRDDRHASSVVEHFRSNLSRMIQLCHQNSLPLLLIQPPSNLSDCPPFKAEFSHQTSAADINHVRELMRQTAEIMRDDPTTAAILLQQAADIDGRFAFVWYQLGKALSAASRFDEARKAFQRARDEDVCPLRMISALETAMQEVSEQEHPEFLNASELLVAECPDGILGDNVLVDHIHPSFRGHQLIAMAIVDWMLSRKFVRESSADWRSRAEQGFVDHIQSLDNMYFFRGRRRLGDLQGWAAGRAEGPPIIRKETATGTVP